MTDIDRTTGQACTPAALARQLALIAARCGGEVVLLPHDRATLTGTPGAVGQLLAAIQGTGRLVSTTTPVPTGVPGQVLVNIRLAPRIQAHAARPARPRRKLPRWAIWAIGSAALLLAGGFAWIAYLAVTAIAAHLAIIGLVAGAVVALVVGGRRTGGRTFSGTFKGKVHS